jgi:alanyl-tRNA synthetase
MPAQKSSEIRQSFLDYFQQNNHTVVPSSSLVPEKDPTLLFTNSGMVQFKDIFLGKETPNYTCAASSQRCVRAGGKHNDLENVGYTARHHTFFEMLGNFSFGDYFKEEAIKYAWEFLVDELMLSPSKLWITVFDDDRESEDIWLHKVKIDQSRFAKLGESDNFWSMGETGPCGPCTEIFYDHGEAIKGGPPGTDNQDGDRFVEIWNLVFMEYNRDKSGHLTHLPSPSVDTGMGLERISAVMQNVHSNYQIDVFARLIEAISKHAKRSQRNESSFNVIADHIRSSAFLITDGVIPSNEGRGYVLRRIIRRALRHANKLNISSPFLSSLVDVLANEMGQAYPELEKDKNIISTTLRVEEEKFSSTLEKGLEILEKDLKRIRSDIVPGETIFRLYDTYGFPVDLTADIARERNLSMDMKGYEKYMQSQQTRSRSLNQFSSTNLEYSSAVQPSKFTGYTLTTQHSNVVALFEEGESRNTLTEGSNGAIALDETPFYAESGGQVGDVGKIIGADFSFEVNDTQLSGKTHLHIGVVSIGKVGVGDAVESIINDEYRKFTVFNHSATHLLHAALKKILGEHVQQKGSLVAPDKLRFDFSHQNRMTEKEISTVEDTVNREISSNIETEVVLMQKEEALDSGAEALFGEKYDDTVRVIKMGNFSIELCGGTHVNNTGEISSFKIVSESGVAAGIRRIEAVTGPIAKNISENQTNYASLTRNMLHDYTKQVDNLNPGIKSDSDDDVQKLLLVNESLENDLAEIKKALQPHITANLDVVLSENISKLSALQRQLQKKIDGIKSKLSSNIAIDLVDKAQKIGNIYLVAESVDQANAKFLRETADALKNKLNDVVILLASVNGKKVTIVSAIAGKKTESISASDLAKHVAEQVGGKAGGKKDMAQGGGDKPEALQTALESVQSWLKDQLK